MSEPKALNLVSVRTSLEVLLGAKINLMQSVSAKPEINFANIYRTTVQHTMYRSEILHSGQKSLKQK